MLETKCVLSNLYCRTNVHESVYKQHRDFTNCCRNKKILSLTSKTTKKGFERNHTFFMFTNACRTSYFHRVMCVKMSLIC